MKKLITLSIFFTFTFLFSLNLEEARSLALKNSLDLKIKENEFEQFRLEVHKAFLGFLPSAEITSTYQKINETQKKSLLLPENYDKKSQSYGYSISYPLFLGGKTLLGLAVSSSAKDIAKLQLQLQKQQTIYTTTIKYLTVIESQQIFNLANLEYQSAQEELRKAEKRFQIGIVSAAEIFQIEANMLLKKASLNQMKTMLDISKNDLVRFLHLDNDVDSITEISVEDYVGFTNFTYELQTILSERLITILKSKNMTLNILNKNININKKYELMEFGDLLPTIALQYSQTWEDGFSPENSFKDQGTMLILNATLPLFPILDEVIDSRKARLETKKSKIEFESTENQLITSTQQLISSFFGLLVQIEAQDLAYKATSATYKKMQTQFNSSVISSTDFINAQAMKSAAQMTLIQTKIDFLKTKTQLLQLVNINDFELLEVLKSTN